MNAWKRRIRLIGLTKIKRKIQMDFIDYYKILEIEKTATEADIKKAYRKLARRQRSQ